MKENENKTFFFEVEVKEEKINKLLNVPIECFDIVETILGWEEIIQQDETFPFESVLSGLNNGIFDYVDLSWELISAASLQGKREFRIKVSQN